jgi:hypothetical protein
MRIRLLLHHAGHPRGIILKRHHLPPQLLRCQQIIPPHDTVPGCRLTPNTDFFDDIFFCVSGRMVLDFEIDEMAAVIALFLWFECVEVLRRYMREQVASCAHICG